MISRWPIRYKLLLLVTLLFLIVATLSISGLVGVSSYRRLVRNLSRRAVELPLADKLLHSVFELRIKLTEIRAHPTRFQSLEFIDVHDALRAYQAQLQKVQPDGSDIRDNRDELELLNDLQTTLQRVEQLTEGEDWILAGEFDLLADELDVLQRLARKLPSHLHDRLQKLKGNVRGQYHALIFLTGITSILSLGMLSLLAKFFYDWVFRPLRVLIRGSRRVAAGDFDHRIQLSTHDEMAELAGAMNDMTSRFQEIRDDLDHQVKQRSKEVVRSEQLASVGYLAAGVAHEINNPLASIAWCAESLESRLHGLLYGEQPDYSESHDDNEVVVLRKYLRRIQDEAFRCKEITEGLLNFSRLGEVEKQQADLNQLVADIIDMVRHLGRYRNKRIEFACEHSVLAPVNSQEIKQVVLNLVTNALDSLAEDGVVELQLERQHDQAILVVRDNGCGMSDDVLEHVFEPFFTRRRDGQGTGLGLSISFRIVMDHGGRIEAFSEGPGRGSQFQVTLPLTQENEDQQRPPQAA